MNIIFIGAGYVGVSSAAIMASFGHDVLVYDINSSRIAALNSGDRDVINLHVSEEGLGDIIMRHATRLRFVSDYSFVEQAVESAEAVFICVPTPDKPNSAGEYDLSYFNSAISCLVSSLKNRNNKDQSRYVVVVIKSTVPINTADELKIYFDHAGIRNVGIVSNPEFLVEGQAVSGSFSPDRVVIGANKLEDFLVMRRIYSRFYVSSKVNYIETGWQEAMAGKLLCNFILFKRLVTTFNVVGRVCEFFPEINFEKVRKIITSDTRIGKWGFYNSIYAGGSCLKKDSLSLAFQLEQVGASSGLVSEMLLQNDYQRDNFYRRVSKEAKFLWTGKVVAVLGVAFKRNTNDIRNSAAVDFIQRLLADGAREIRVFDPMALSNLRQYFINQNIANLNKIVYCKDIREAIFGSHASLILTDWPEFSAVDGLVFDLCPAPYLVIDGRRMLSHQYSNLQLHGYDVLAVGSPFLKGVS